MIYNEINNLQAQLYPNTVPMPRSKDPRKTHLKQRGESWYLNFPVPTDVQARYLTADGNPKSHIVQALGTTDLNEAARVKYQHIHQLQIEFRKVRRELAGAMPQDLEVAKALAADLKEAANQEDYEMAETIADVISGHAQRIHEAGGETKESLLRAKSFAKVASGEQLIVDAFQDWMDKATLPERTKGKYKTAIDEFVRFLGPHALLSNITFENALRYTDWLNGEARSLRTKKAVPLAYNTKRDRIQALSTFWTHWIKRRQKTTLAVNPWASMTVTAKPTLAIAMLLTVTTIAMALASKSTNGTSCFDQLSSKVRDWKNLVQS